MLYLDVSLSVCYVYGYPQKPKEGSRSPEASVMGRCESLCKCWEPNS